MIKLFRKVRQRLLNDHKFSKYLLYAVGEIVLVVLGILIALQLNNLNEKRKLRMQELTLIAAVQSDLHTCQIEIKATIHAHELSVKRIELIAKYLEENLAYSHHLDSCFARLSNWYSPYFTYSAYETLKNKGLNIIQNQALRKKIVEMYELDFAVLINDMDKPIWNYAQTVVMPITTKYIRKKSMTSAEPNDYEALKKNDEFINMLHYLISDRKYAVIQFSNANTKLEILLSDIEKELMSRKSN